MFSNDDAASRLRSITSRIKYKPGWKFDVLSEDYTVYKPWEPLTLIASMQPPSVDDPKKFIPLQMSFTVNRDSMRQMTDDDVVNFIISGLIRNFELHEMDEWLTFDGKHVREPHPELKKQIA